MSGFMVDPNVNREPCSLFLQWLNNKLLIRYDEQHIVTTVQCQINKSKVCWFIAYAHFAYVANMWSSVSVSIQNFANLYLYLDLDLDLWRAQLSEHLIHLLWILVVTI